MLIRTLTRAAGRLNWRPGQQVELPEVEARELIQTGQAVAAVVPAVAKAAAKPAMPQAAAVAESVAKKPSGKKQK